MQAPARHHPLQCRCGRLRGSLAQPGKAVRARCYCRDCQAYARALGKPELVLDELGGTDVVASLQQRVAFDAGTEALACLSLREGGLLRWYASCCDTPIANTTRDRRLSYVGLVHSCLGPSPQSLDAAFGPSRVAVNTGSAKGKVASGGLGALLPMARIFASVARARLDGSYRKSPFFGPADAKPVATPRVLSAAERKAAY